MNILVFAAALAVVQPAAPVQPCRVFVTEEKVNPMWYETIKDLKYSKKWYGDAEGAYRNIAKKAHAVEADAVVAVDISFRPSGFSWAAPHATGIAVKWTDVGRENFASLKGRCYSEAEAKSEKRTKEAR
jgi:uncharacterized protein YbjQ (UPF0145 family)